MLKNCLQLVSYYNVNTNSKDINVGKIMFETNNCINVKKTINFEFQNINLKQNNTSIIIS